MAKVPVRKVKVPPFTYTIEDNPDLLGLLGGDGASNANNQMIALDFSQGPDFLRDTLLHEILHMVWAQTPLYENSEKGKDYEERVIGALSPRILSFLQSNRRLVLWLMGVDDTESSTGKRKKTPREETDNGISEG